jgi:hypothetical protein
MLAFDAPGREVCVVRRQITATPLQPLILLNDPQFVEAARGLGEIIVSGPGTLEERLVMGFRRAATRAPTESEVKLLIQLYERQHGIFADQPSRAEAYLKTGRRPVPVGTNAIELAAATATANAILNLDAALMVR